MLTIDLFALKFKRTKLLLEEIFGGCMIFMVLLCGEVPLLKSDNFCRDLDKDVVLKTEDNNFFVSFDFFLLL